MSTATLPTGCINANAARIWSSAGGLPVEIIETFTWTCRVRLLSDLVVDGCVKHRAGVVQLVLRDWVTVDGEQVEG